ncbi:hypothetical protein GGX14DRAFT_633247 [Mycena pura]|uniref:Uncharacterized protein n=1 Tax=Mycena pura TaxID=153505 RepID=A0AAD6YE73_9AGAR|nr:hypothetical protein GGX14DRAFT_633247 [Mycena pura]
MHQALPRDACIHWLSIKEILNAVRLYGAPFSLVQRPQLTALASRLLDHIYTQTVPARAYLSLHLRCIPQSTLRRARRTAIPSSRPLLPKTTLPPRSMPPSTQTSPYRPTRLFNVAEFLEKAREITQPRLLVAADDRIVEADMLVQLHNLFPVCLRFLARQLEFSALKQLQEDFGDASGSANAPSSSARVSCRHGDPREMFSFVDFAPNKLWNYFRFKLEDGALPWLRRLRVRVPKIMKLPYDGMALGLGHKPPLNSTLAMRRKEFQGIPWGVTPLEALDTLKLVNAKEKLDKPGSGGCRWGIIAGISCHCTRYTAETAFSAALKRSQGPYLLQHVSRPPLSKYALFPRPSPISSPFSRHECQQTRSAINILRQTNEAPQTRNRDQQNVCNRVLALPVEIARKIGLYDKIQPDSCPPSALASFCGAWVPSINCKDNLDVSTWHQDTRTRRARSLPSHHPAPGVARSSVAQHSD